MNNPEDKGQKRVFVKKKVTINESIKAFAIDITENGMYICSSESFPKDSVINVDLIIKEGEMSLNVKAKVEYINEEVGYGVKFIELNLQDKDKLKEFLSETEKNHLDAEKIHAKKVLLVDDSETTRRVYKNSLITEGFFVIEAVSGMDGIKKLKEGIPLLIVLDIMMEDMDGYKFLQIIRMNPEWEKIPVLVLSGRMTSTEMERAAALDISDYMVKATTSPKKLVEKVKEVLERVSKEDNK